MPNFFFFCLITEGVSIYLKYNNKYIHQFTTASTAAEISCIYFLASGVSNWHKFRHKHWFLFPDQYVLLTLISQGISWSDVKEIQLLFNNLHWRQHRQPAKPQKHNQMVREFHTHADTMLCCPKASYFTQENPVASQHGNLRVILNGCIMETAVPTPNLGQSFVLPWFWWSCKQHFIRIISVFI